MLLDLRKYVGEQGQSKGNLIKWEIPLDGTDDLYFIKTGRAQTREFPKNFGIEPVIELITYEFAKLLKIPCAEEKLDTAIIKHYNEEKITLVNVSKDFRRGNQFFEFGNYPEITDEPIRRDFRSIEGAFGNYTQLVQMVLFDLIILNEDRHDHNFGYLLKDGNWVFSPLYDNGYSLLYDNISGMKENYKSAVRMCSCNSFYLSFHEASTIIRDFKRRNDLRSICNINLRNSTVENMLKRVDTQYMSIITSNKVNNIPLDGLWFQRVYEFLIWRLEYVRDL